MSQLPIVYLPGAGGRSSFWRPVADRLWRRGAPVVLGYPGFGDVPPEPALRSLADLYDALLAMLPARFHLVAQSMGNVLALRAAIERPERVASLALCAVTGGVDVRAFGGAEWRDAYRAELPSVPAWFVDDVTDLDARLGSVAAPTLVLSGDADPLSPVPVGEHLRDRLPSAELRVIRGGTHSMAEDAPDLVAGAIGEFLSRIDAASAP